MKLEGKQESDFLLKGLTSDMLLNLNMNYKPHKIRLHFIIRKLFRNLCCISKRTQSPPLTAFYFALLLNKSVISMTATKMCISKLLNIHQTVIWSPSRVILVFKYSNSWCSWQNFSHREIFDLISGEKCEECQHVTHARDGGSSTTKYILC